MWLRALQTGLALRARAKSWVPHRTPAVSVVVPVFGTEAHLGECLTSLVGQSFRDFEIIVVDDASPGGAKPAEVLLTKDLPLTILRHPTNLGPLSARLTGAGAAQGRYLAFVDSDDWVDRRFIEAMYAEAVHAKADLVQCAIRLHHVNTGDLVVNRGGASHAATGEDALAELLVGGMSNSLCNKLIRTEVWRTAVRQLSASFHDIRFAEDLLCLFHIAMACRSYRHLDEPLYHYIRRDGSVTLSQDPSTAIRQEADLRRVHAAISEALRGWGGSAALVHAFVSREFPIAGLAPGPP